MNKTAKTFLSLVIKQNTSLSKLLEQKGGLFFGSWEKNKAMYSHVFVITIFLLFSCSEQPKQGAQLHIKRIELQPGDTLSPKNPIPNNQSCRSLAQGYFLRFGLIISNFYEIQESSLLDYNNDGFLDTFTIISPLSLIPTPEKGGVCIWNNQDTIEDRLLLIKSHFKKGSKVLIYPNVISNQATIAWQGYESVEESPNGFQLHAVKGQGYVVEYFIRVVQHENSFYIREIKLACTAPYREKTLNYKAREFPLENYSRSVIDSLRSVYDM